MTLPMVTCPLCCRPGFSSSESLCSALVDVTTRNLSCPVCNCKVTGLDKFTIHLFSHSFSHNTTNNSTQVANTSEADSATKCDNLTVDGEKHQYSHYNNSSFDKQDCYLRSNISSTITKNIPSDQSYIFFRTDNGQIFAVSHESFSPNFKNVTINTQNYITNTNITTSTIRANSVGNVEERKHVEVLDKDSSCTANAMDIESNTGLFTNGESLHSCPSTPSTFADVDICRNERVYESCKELLTNGDFSTNGTDIGDLERNDSYVENKNSGENNSNNKECENKTVESYTCEQCSYVFPNKTILAMHNQLIHKKGENEVESRRQSLNCNLCPRTFTLRSSLMIHRKVAHAGGFGNNDSTLSIKDSSLNNSCQVCGKIFSKAIYLSQHMKVHEEKQWLCTICDKGFTTKYFLKKHRRLHTGEMPYRCKTCSKSFTFQQTYRKHLLYHSNDKPYCCAQCGRLFKELSTLHNHERIHSGEKPFACETCGKAFRQRVSYLVHRRIHTGAMPYKCTSCNKSFRYKISQRTHKCTAQPPGIVVRTQGYLVQRLQAAMNKAAEVREAKKAEEKSDMVVCTSQSIVESASSEIKAISPDTSNGKDCISLKQLEVSGAYNNQKNPDILKTINDKSQLYLLIKGPNGETYYQPVIISQNLMSSPQQNCTIIQNMTVNADSQKFSDTLSSGLQCNDLLDKNQHKLSVKSLSAENITKDLKLPEINETPKDEKLSTSTKDNNKISDLMIDNNKVEDLKACNATKTVEEISTESSFDRNNDSSTDVNSSILSELFDNLIYTNNVDASFNDVNNEPHSSHSNSSNDTTMESSDFFSLTFSPSLSSPSDSFGQLSLSSNSPKNISSQTCKPKSPSLTNLDHSHDSFFENLTEDSLKELLFGGMK